MSRHDLRNGAVGPTLLGLAGPMIVGIAAIMTFNLVDAFWVGQLGARELAAMSFTFPITFLVTSVSMGMGVGVTSVVARAIGTGDRARVRRLATDSLALANAAVVLLALLGLLTLDRVSRALGATEDMLPLIRDYMLPWYLGIGFLVIPQVGNAILRATGDTRTPSYVMLLVSLLNAVLDPVLIFGLGPFPRLELRGAAVATVISYAVTFVASLWILHRREKLIDLSRPRLAEVLGSWRQVLQVALPAIGSQMLMPLSSGVVTSMVARFGPAAVAGFGVGTRVESLALLGITAMSMSMVPFVGQNAGARDSARVRAALRFAIRYALVYGAVAVFVLAALAGPVARGFSDDARVIEVARRYLWLLPFSYGALGVGMMVNATFNAVHLPLRATLLVAVRLFVLAVPLAWLGGRLGAEPGLFLGIAAANLLTGGLAYALIRRYARSLPTALGPAPAGP